MNPNGIVVVPLLLDMLKNEISVRQAKEKYEGSIGLACENNPTLFWKYVKRKLKMPTGISSLLNGNTLVSSEKDKTNLLNRYFSRIYAK